MYNLGCALQAQKKNKEALSEYKKATKVSENSLHKSKAYYNIGTIFQGQKKYDEAIESYKDALRNNPNNNNARYNLELCKQQQKRQQQKRQQQQKSKNKKNNSKQQNKNKKNKNNSNKRDQKRDKEMSKDNAERLLDAAMQQEKLTQKRLSKAMHQPSDHQLNKNW
ncbi:tetratricopeptide repeat protein [Prevotella amnii]|uniref:tetratricopeptide repeat protein n=1 Tax=Prevotella amnii TaxID=419005 RepID=UPI001EE21881|nr:tetratricopeptide repeat protein [Prevotella amnii]